MTEPVIVTLDIETAPLIASTFSLWPKSGIGVDNLIEDWWIICASWKYLDKKTVHGISVLNDKDRFKEDFTDDYAVVQKLHEVLSNCDFVVGHNISRFDLPRINTRFIKHGLPPVPKTKIIDTYKIAKREFNFTSNRLDYIAKFLGVGAKKENPKGLWQRVLQGNKKAVRDMLAYNKQDVVINEKVYLALRSFDNSTNMSNYVDDRSLGKKLLCPKCGSNHIKKQGLRVLASGKFQQYQCLDCGGWSRGKNNLRAKEHTGVILSDQTLSN